MPSRKFRTIHPFGKGRQGKRKRMREMWRKRNLGEKKEKLQVHVGLSQSKVDPSTPTRTSGTTIIRMASDKIAMATYQIRKATPEDCEAIVGLIKELAVYESMPDQVDMTPGKLREDAFCDQPFVNQLVAVDTKSNTVVGYSSFSYMYSTWKGRTVYLDDVYVTPAHRGSGLGTSLMQSVAKVAFEQRGCNRMNWIVLSWNERPKQLYARLGGENLTLKESWENITLFQEQLKNFATNYKVKIPDNTSVDIQL